MDHELRSWLVNPVLKFQVLNPLDCKGQLVLAFSKLPTNKPKPDMKAWISAVRASSKTAQEGNDRKALLVDQLLLELTYKFQGSLTVLQKWNRIQELRGSTPPILILDRLCKRFKSYGQDRWALVGRSLGIYKRWTKLRRQEVEVVIWGQFFSSRSDRWCSQ
jgi:hypothetical protein